MSAYLLITLAAPLASFGEQAGNARRGSAARPTKSALLGLLGAALGVTRDDASGQAALARDHQVATRSWRAGSLLQDFHTYQSLPRKHKAATRAEALAQKDKLETTLTVREYRQDVFYEAAFSATPDARWSLEALEAALRAPCFTLSLGRRSCPLAWPLCPVILEAETVDAAFDAYAETRAALAKDAPGLEQRLRRTSGPREIAVEDLRQLGARPEASTAHRRRDQPGDRVRWHFEPRTEHVAPLPLLPPPPEEKR